MIHVTAELNIIASIIAQINNYFSYTERKSNNHLQSDKWVKLQQKVRDRNLVVVYSCKHISYYIHIFIHCLSALLIVQPYIGYYYNDN